MDPYILNYDKRDPSAIHIFFSWEKKNKTCVISKKGERFLVLIFTGLERTKIFYVYWLPSSYCFFRTTTTYHNIVPPKRDARLPSYCRLSALLLRFKWQSIRCGILLMLFMVPYQKDFTSSRTVQFCIREEWDRLDMISVKCRVA